MKLNIILASALAATFTLAAPASATDQLSKSIQADGLQLTLNEKILLKRFRDQDEHARANHLIKRAQARNIASRDRGFTSGNKRSRSALLFDLRVARQDDDHARARFIEKQLRNR